MAAPTQQETRTLRARWPAQGAEDPWETIEAQKDAAIRIGGRLMAGSSETTAVSTLQKLAAHPERARSERDGTGNRGSADGAYQFSSGHDG